MQVLRHIGGVRTNSDAPLGSSTYRTVTVAVAVGTIFYSTVAVAVAVGTIF